MKSIRQYFDTLAPVYNPGVTKDGYPVREKIAEFCPDSLSGLDILDLGCGTGLLAEPISGYLRLYGTDLSQKSLKEAQETGNYDGLTAADITDGIGFKDNSFDLIISGGVLDFVRDLKSVGQELCRILKPGGQAIITLGNTKNRKNYGYAEITDHKDCSVVRLPENKVEFVPGTKVTLAGITLYLRTEAQLIEEFSALELVKKDEYMAFKHGNGDEFIFSIFLLRK